MGPKYVIEHWVDRPVGARYGWHQTGEAGNWVSALWLVLKARRHWPSARISVAFD